MNSGPVNGWDKGQSSLRSEAAALASVTLYLDELATYLSLDIKCKFQLYVDSTSAISNVVLIREKKFRNAGFQTMQMCSPRCMLPIM